MQEIVGENIWECPVCEKRLEEEGMYPNYCYYCGTKRELI